jgi:aminobenzoyl-glutamate transport protein
VSADTAPPEEETPQGQKGFLGTIERIGNKIPHPAIIFLGLIAIVVLLSAILSWAGIEAQVQVATPQGTEVVPD